MALKPQMTTEQACLDALDDFRSRIGRLARQTNGHPDVADSLHSSLDSLRNDFLFHQAQPNERGTCDYLSDYISMTFRKYEPVEEIEAIYHPIDA